MSGSLRATPPNGMRGRDPRACLDRTLGQADRGTSRISCRTVEKHLQRYYAKLGVRDRDADTAQAVCSCG